MSKDTSLYIEDSPRNYLVASIRWKINEERFSRALKLPKHERGDEIENVIRDAVKNSSIVSFSGIPHVYCKSKGKYVKFDYYEFKMSLYDTMRKAGVPNGYYGSIERLVKLCWAEVQSRKCAVDNSIVVMKNGVYDTMDNTLKPFSDRFMTNSSVDFEYNPNELSTKWRDFLNEVLPDIEMQSLLQEFVAAAFVDRKSVKIEYALVLLGKGSNGKSVVFETIMNMLGDDGISNFSIADLISNTRREQNIAACNGKRLNYCSEIRTTEIGEKNADAFKSIVSGESQMARSLYKEPFRATDIPLIMANANKMPKLSDASKALERRILIIPFETYISEERQNPELSSELKEEMPGIFNWVIEGLIRLKSNKFKIEVPSAVKQLVADYIKENNDINRWLDEVRYFSGWHPYTVSSPEWITVTNMYARYSQWCKDNGEIVKTKRVFAEELNIVGFQRIRRSDGWGYLFYKTQNNDDIRAANMDIAISMQSNIYLESLKAAAASGSIVKVTGVNELERYLGLPENSIWPYLKAGKLDGAFLSMGDGKPVFDVKKTQMLLADSQFYSDFKEDKNGCKKRAYSALRGMRISFNSRMRTMGVPIRKFGNCVDRIPAKDKDCWLVDDDWEYSKRSAELVMMKPK